jgi:hypothetical protein
MRGLEPQAGNESIVDIASREMRDKGIILCRDEVPNIASATVSDRLIGGR